ncbi:MAG: NAD-dependent epimerase/dehydratase family protein [Magnetococcales bacterium]|nr:NAD-dependent epimerase/dehydratase family protein [Magnetococcales bacterium]
MNDTLLESDIREICDRVREAAPALSGKNVVMTGGLGFLGRYFVQVFKRLNEEYLAEPCRVRILDNLITAGEAGRGLVAPEHMEILHQDVTEPCQLPGPVHFILHMAGIASPFYYQAYPLKTLDVSVIGTRQMLELARANPSSRMVFFSSSEIYGDPDPKHVPIPESYRGNVSCQGPRACYDESKRLGETLLHIYHKQFGTHTNVIRPFNVFGPGMQEVDYRALPNFAACVKGNRPLSVYDTGNQTRTFCYITDAVVGFLLVMLKGVPGEAYNIGNATPEVSILDLVKRMEKVLQRELSIRTIEYPDSYPADEPRRRCPEIRKARLQLGYAPLVSLDEGLGRFLGWTERHFTGAL